MVAVWIIIKSERWIAFAQSYVVTYKIQKKLLHCLRHHFRKVYLETIDFGAKVEKDFENFWTLK